MLAVGLIPRLDGARQARHVSDGSCGGHVTERIVVRMDTVDECILPPNVTQGYKEASRTDNKSPGDFINSGKWEGYTPPPLPKK
jgi:hypothetical protein